MVYIVLKNGSVDEVFSSLEAARHHCRELRRKWNMTEIIERKVLDI